MIVEQIDVGNMLKNYTYILHNNKSAWVIDPYNALQVQEVLDSKSLDLKGILNTHAHFDHTKGNKKLLKLNKAKLYDYKKNINIDLSNGYFLTSIQTPGHTLDHISFLVSKDNQQLAFFAGDLLFHMGVGNTKNGGDINILFQTIKKIKKEIDREVKFYPGHKYYNANHLFSESILKEQIEFKDHETFGDELDRSLFFQFDDEKLRIKLNKNHGQDLKNGEDVFKFLRFKRDSF